MKNLSNCLKLLTIMLFLFAGCKKDTEKKVAEPIFDLMDYVIVAKEQNNGSNLPVLIYFQSNSKAIYVLSTGIFNPVDYTFIDGVLTISIGGQEKFTIKDNKIVKYVGAASFIEHTLVKIPSTSQFTNRTFTGSWAKTGSYLFLFAKLKFNDIQYGESGLNEPVLNRPYITIKNLAAFSTEYDRRTFFICINGKIEGSEFNPITEVFRKGSFDQQ